MKKVRLVIMMVMVMLGAMALVGCGNNAKYHNPQLIQLLDYTNPDDILSLMGDDYSDEKERGKYYAEYRPATMDDKQYTSVMVHFDQKTRELNKVEYLAYNWTKEDYMSVYEDLNKKYEAVDYDPEKNFNHWKLTDKDGNTFGTLTMQKGPDKEAYVIGITVTYK